MAGEAINKIVAAENSAKEIIDKANVQSKEIIKTAEQKANNNYDNVIRNAKDKISKIKKKAEEEGLEKSNPIFAQGNKSIEMMKNIPKDKVDAAVNLIVERIVNFNGHS